MKNICIVTLIGIPGAGKTTLAKLLTDALAYDFQIQAIHINYDNLINIIKSEEQFAIKPYNEIRNDIMQAVCQLVNLFQSKPINFLSDIERFILSRIDYKIQNHSTVIIVDDNLYYRSMRYDYYKISKHSEISFFQIFLKVDLGIALNRNDFRNKDNKIPEKVIKRMALRLEVPNIRNHWEKNSLTINSNNEITQNIVNEIINHTNNMFLYPLKNSAAPLTVVEQSFLHKIDLRIRKLIHNEIQKNIANKTKVKDLSEYLNEKRKGLLKDIKLGIIEVNDETAQETIEINMKYICDAD